MASEVHEVKSEVKRDPETEGVVEEKKPDIEPFSVDREKVLSY